ncbi:MAG TPA: polyprenol monophosphomannose synthase [Vicinamibacterales bacterium]|nr:polyprenol monophosphomannose synthase [Vicinamibacterales bacterium]
MPAAKPPPAALSIVVPTYNERDRLTDLVAAVFDAYATAGLEAELIIVDDNSPDGTGAIAEELARRHRITVIHRPGKLGLGTAVVAGFESASAPVVGVIDADLSHPPALLPRMLGVMQRTAADVVIGSRYIPGGGTRNWPLGRLLMSQVACLMARPLTPVRDATSGFFLIRRDLARGVSISAGGFKICLELLVRGRPASVVEVPYVFEGRTAGQSKMNLREALGYFRQLRDLRAFTRARPPLTQSYVRLAEDAPRDSTPVAAANRESS